MMSTEQPEALRLAKILIDDAYWSPMLGEQAAAELRRLHEDCEDWKQGYALLFKENADRRRLNEDLVEALRKCSEQLTRLGYSANHADQALAKAETP
jgi:hypothetical protein